MYDFIRDRLAELNRTQKELAEYLDIPAPHLNAILSGKRNIKSKEIVPMAKFLNIKLEDFIKYISGQSGKNELEPLNTNTIFKVGFVEAGAWYQACQLPEIDWEQVHYPLRASLIGRRIFALGVKGDSMNMVFPPDRTTLICCEINDWGVEPENGDYVIAYRHNEIGECEATVKRFYKVSDDKYILRPESTNKEFFDIAVTNDGNEYEIHAIVIDYITRLKD